jgi:demethylmenaquinone methyltransferase/2-methoxy-6-polyprenyl-1,4-benzoquinol methylase
LKVAHNIEQTARDKQMDKTIAQKDEVRKMFNSIAHRYDFLNHFLSFGVDYYWRRRVLRIVKKIKPESILDIATGTADLAILMSKAKPKKIIGVDISASMLQRGREKLLHKGLNNLIELELGDAENLKYEDESFDLAMVSFGVRNFENLEKGLNEINRVLKPNGKLIILEFSKPNKFPIKQLYQFYSFRILPLIGRLISNDASAYTYLPESVAHFPAYEDFLEVMKSCNFLDTKYEPLSGGISSIYQGSKKI